MNNVASIKITPTFDSPNNENTMTKDTKEIAKEIRTAIKAIKGVKLSVVTTHSTIDIAVMSAPAALVGAQIVRGNATFGTDSVRPFDGEYSVQKRYSEDRNLTEYGKEVFAVIAAVVDAHHWDKSDVQSDYFNCAFYYHYKVGKYGKPFEVK